MEELDGVETERSRSGMASRASEGETLGDGELDLCSGEVAPLTGALAVVSDILMVVMIRELHSCLQRSGVSPL